MPLAKMSNQELKLEKFPKKVSKICVLHQPHSLNIGLLCLKLLDPKFNLLKKSFYSSTFIIKKAMAVTIEPFLRVSRYSPGYIHLRNFLNISHSGIPPKTIFPEQIGLPS